MLYIIFYLLIGVLCAIFSLHKTDEEIGFFLFWATVIIVAILWPFIVIYELTIKNKGKKS